MSKIDKEILKGIMTYVSIYGGLTLLIWIGAYKVSAMTEEVSVVIPEKGIKCVVVSRAFNTSIDCWKEND